MSNIKCKFNKGLCYILYYIIFYVVMIITFPKQAINSSDPFGNCFTHIRELWVTLSYTLSKSFGVDTLSSFSSSS